MLFPLDMAIQGMWYNPKNFFIQIIPTLVLTQILPVIGPKNATWYSTSILIAIYPSYLSICDTSSVLWISWNGSHNIWFLIIFAIINLLFCRVFLNLWLTGVYLGLNYIRSFWLRCSQKRSSVSHIMSFLQCVPLRIRDACILCTTEVGREQLL